MKTNEKIALCFIYLTFSGDAFRLKEKADDLASKSDEPGEKNTDEWVEFKINEKFSNFAEKPSMKFSGSGGSIGKLWRKFTPDNKQYAKELLQESIELLNIPENPDPEVSEDEDDILVAGIAKNLQLGMNRWFHKHREEDAYKGCAFNVKNLNSFLEIESITMPLLQKVVEAVIVDAGPPGAGPCKVRADMAHRLAGNPWWAQGLVDNVSPEEEAEINRKLAQLESIETSNTNTSLVELSETALVDSETEDGGVVVIILIVLFFVLCLSGSSKRSGPSAAETSRVYSRGREIRTEANRGGGYARAHGGRPMGRRAARRQARREPRRYH